MRVDAFDFDLPEDRIALRPAKPRDAARLLVAPAGMQGFEDRSVGDLPALLAPGDVIVVNDAKVIPARLRGVRRRGDLRARVEVTLHLQDGASRWWAFARPAKRLLVGERISFSPSDDDRACGLDRLAAEVVEKREEGEVLLAFEFAGPILEEALARIGAMPLPPYIAARREGDECDQADYQTLFARRPGAVAAPTAGLHFTPDLVARLEARGVELRRTTLYVGAGTFLPVKAEDTQAHRMHEERFEIDQETADALNEARRRGGRLVCVGTTSLRALESATDEQGVVRALQGSTRLFITPGYRFRAADVLLTNFHLPRSTLFMLVAAFSGLDRMRRAYAHAIETGYRFYSYGDACLLFRSQSGA